jgi:hypothetical protein
MARKKEKTNAAFDDFFAMQIDEKRKANLPIIGIPLEAISLRYLFGNDVFPIGRMTELVGVSESCKTAFLFEIYRWHIYNTSEHYEFDPSEMHGGYVHNLIEQRDSPDLRSSILQLGRPDPYPVVKSHTVEDWQLNCTNWVKRAEEKFSPGAMSYPIAIGVDSITAVTTRDEQEKTWDAGYAQPNFSQIAKSINMWAKVFFNKMEPWPLSLIAVNHLKENRAPNGSISRNVPGGSALKFASTFMLRLQKRDDIELLNLKGRIIEIHTEKNSLSPGCHESLKVRMTWTCDDDGNQHTIWDWHDATIELLTSFDATRKKRIMDIVAIENIDKTRRTADCSQLGLKKVSWSELGKAIMNNKEIAYSLDKFFGVRNRRKFEIGTPYCDQTAAANEGNPSQD